MKTEPCEIDWIQPEQPTDNLVYYGFLGQWIVYYISKKPGGAYRLLHPINETNIRAIEKKIADESLFFVHDFASLEDAKRYAQQLNGK